MDQTSRQPGRSNPPMTTIIMSSNLRKLNRQIRREKRAVRRLQGMIHDFEPLPDITDHDRRKIGRFMLLMIGIAVLVPIASAIILPLLKQ